METKAKTKSIFSKMLVALVIVATLIAGIFMALPKTTEVHAAEPGSSATLLGGGNIYANWISKLSQPVTLGNVESIVITSNSDSIIGFDQGVDGEGYAINIAEDGSTPIYYYYKATGNQIEVEDGDNINLYDVVIYADVEIIYAPENSSYLFSMYESNQNLRRMISSLISIRFDNFNTSKVYNMDYMFYGCYSLTSLDISAFDMTNIETVTQFVEGCTELTSIITPINMQDAKIDLYYYYDANGESYNSITADCQNKSLTIKNGQFYSNWNTEWENASGLSYANNVETLLITTDSNKISGFTNSTPICIGVTAYWKESGNTDSNGNVLYDLVIYSNVDKIYALNDSAVGYMFASGGTEVLNLKSIVFEDFDTSGLKSMNQMFYNCSALTELDLSSFNTSNVTSMERMFYGCTSLKSLNLKGFNTSLVTELAFSKYGGGYTGSMFQGLTSLETLDISTFTINTAHDASVIKTMLLSDCTSLKQLHVPANLNGYEIDLADGVELYVNGEGDVVTTVADLHEGTILTEFGVTPSTPSEPSNPTLPESGVTMLDLVILTMLTLTISGVSLMLLKRKKAR